MTPTPYGIAVVLHTIENGHKVELHQQSVAGETVDELCNRLLKGGPVADFISLHPTVPPEVRRRPL